jgi:hypothetical protein
MISMAFTQAVILDGNEERTSLSAVRIYAGRSCRSHGFLLLLPCRCRSFSKSPLSTIQIKDSAPIPPPPGLDGPKYVSANQTVTRYFPRATESCTQNCRCRSPLNSLAPQFPKMHWCASPSDHRESTDPNAHNFSPAVMRGESPATMRTGCIRPAASGNNFDAVQQASALV